MAVSQTRSRYEPKPLKHGDPGTCTCPHCWTVFPYEDVLYIARHPDLIGDPMLPEGAASRFKPTRFSPEGQAIDPGGVACLEKACPACHLEVPQSLFEFKSLFLSVVGVSGSGKSFFLAVLAWHMRQLLSRYFRLTFTDLEMSLNAKLHSYEETLFFAKDPEALVTLPKTLLQGDLYNRVSIEGTETLYPKPFLFTLKPEPAHPELAKGAEALSRTLILYDNAGEHFNPNQDSSTQPGTMHMARSDYLFFMFDPTQDPRFRAKLTSEQIVPGDPQLEAFWPIRQQYICFSEAARRIRAHVGVPNDTKYKKPVVVIVNKFDLWKHLVPRPINPEPFVWDRNQVMAAVDTSYVEDVSFTVRSVLLSLCPEVVRTVEDFSSRVTYIPVSSIGHSPVRKENAAGESGLYVRPSQIKPFWVAIPFLYAFARLALVYRGTKPIPPNIPRARLIEERNSTLFCGLPDGSRIEIPSRLEGKLLHHPQTGEAFLVPMSATRALASTSVGGSAAGIRPPPPTAAQPPPPPHRTAPPPLPQRTPPPRPPNSGT